MIDLKKTWDAGMHEGRTKPEDILFNDLCDVISHSKNMDDILSALANLSGEIMAAVLKIAADQLPARQGATDVLQTLHEGMNRKFLETMHKRTIAAIN